MTRLGSALLATSLLASLCAAAARAQAADPLASLFHAPPASAKPRVWWHWLNGNITERGIDEDLAWMSREGVGGAQTFDGAFTEPAGPFHTPQVVDHPLTYMSPAWKAAFRHAVKTADAKGLDFGIASSPGWSETAGPWVEPEAAMKKLVWSETEVAGGRPIAVALPAPPSVTGPFQSIPLEHSNLDALQGPVPALYRDAAVIAYRVPAAEAVALPSPRVSASAPLDLAALTDGNLNRTVDLPFAAGAESWVKFDYGAPVTLRALRLAAKKSGGFGPGFGAAGPAGRIEASEDGQTFRTLATLPTDGAPEQTVAFPATTARVFRVVFEASKPSPTAVFTGAPTPTSHALAELAFEAAARVNRFEDKAGFAVAPDLVDQPTPDVASAAAIAPGEVVDLTARMRPDGRLDWTPPPGRWAVLRLGWSLIGTLNHPASPAGTGLEVDKLSVAHVGDYIATYLGLYQSAVGPDLMGARGVREMVNDSWEAGAQNWTEDMLAEFQRRRGYDARPWLPVLTGRVVGSARASDAFLFDYRITLGEMLADNHYGVLSRALHARGMGRYGESHETGRAFIGDGMAVKKTTDVPMGATWAQTPPGTGPTNYDADVRESASVAHLYGQNLVAAESFTTAGDPYSYTPALLRPVADRMMANGVNRFVIHTSVHQPDDRRGPGLTLAVFGQWFTRKETWAEDAHAWTDYLARSSALLQQGRFVADVAVLYPEDRNITELYADHLPDVPAGYAYDFVNADALLHQLKAEGGRLVSPSGAAYRVLAVDPRTRVMSLAVLEKLHTLKVAGVRIVGVRPQTPGGLMDDPEVYARLARETFPDDADSKLAAALSEASEAAAPDVDDRGAGLAFVHRRLPDTDIYFVSNPKDAARAAQASFRIDGRPAEIWRADTGEITPASYRMEGDRTIVDLDLAAHDAVFVVFRGQGPRSRIVAPPSVTPLKTLTTGWRLRFPDAKVLSLARLASWTESADPEVRYFSGRACYETSLDAPPAWMSRGHVTLDLGQVKEVADVTLDGRPVGIAWKPPYRVDISPALKTGANALKVCVANLWPNRLIGDKQPGARPHAFAAFDPFTKDTPLRPSGLLGPVRLLQITP